MFLRIPFTESETVAYDSRPGRFGGPPTPIMNTPVTPRRNLEALFWDKHPYWMPGSSDAAFLMACWNEHMGRGGPDGLVDDLGIEWVYEATAGGSIVHPEKPQLLEDVNDWKEKVHIPDPSTWDWAGAAAKTKVDSRFSLEISFTNGFWFERMISLMGFVNAAMALLDEEQTDAIKEMFQAFTDFGCRCIDLVCEYFPLVDVINVHDDWGSQQSTFFSEEIARELFLPYMKQITDHIHSKGRVASLHSCGHNDARVQVFIDAGFDEWQPQDMNDIKWLYENYGDKIVLGVFPERTDLAQLSEEEQREEARKFVDFYCKPGKPAMMGVVASRRGTPAFLDEVYRYSRKLYLEQE